MLVRKRTWVAGLLLALGILILIFLQRPSDVARYNPSDHPAYIPSSTDSFTFYIEENRRRIRAALTEYYFGSDAAPFGPAYTLEDVVDMRAPYQLLPRDGDCEAGTSRKGFLLVHGLTDSPYLLRSVAESLAEIYPCAVLYGLLSPGHGTIPGDLLNVRLEQWVVAFEYGLNSLSREADELNVIGYSNGSALALNYLNLNRESELISKLILLSPGLETADTRAQWTPYLRYFLKWIVEENDSDAVKYESFPTNAAAEFYKLAKSVVAPDYEPIDTPTLMVVSADDTTINSQASADFFCRNLDSGTSRLLWLQSPQGGSTLQDRCAGITVRQGSFSDARFVSYSHVALTLPSQDAHYGIDGNNPVCLAHADFPDRYRRCLDGDGSAVYAENNYLDTEGEFNGRIVRRATYNPAYDELIADIQCFIEEDCRL